MLKLTRITKYIVMMFLFTNSLVFAGPSFEPPPPPNPPTHRSPFPGLDIEQYIPLLIIVAMLYVFFLTVVKKKKLA